MLGEPYLTNNAASCHDDVVTGHRQRTPARRPRPPEESAQPEQRLDAGVDLHGWRLITRWWQVDRATQWPMHQHREHELIWDVSGTLSVTMAGRLWLVPPGAGLWVPSGTEHEVAASVSQLLRLHLRRAREHTRAVGGALRRRDQPAHRRGAAPEQHHRRRPPAARPHR
ncbi:cupin domain-containing protein [Salana multivorans]